MASGGAGKMKLLFLVSRDFGEVTNAIYLALEPEFDSCLLVPPSLYAIHREDLPVPIQPYESMPEIMAAVERMRPDVVFLFSGYLFANNGIFSNEEMAELIQALRQRGCRVVTSDPFFGLLAQMDDSFPYETEAERERNRQLLRAHAVLERLPHVYDVDPRGLVASPTLVYANRAMVRPPAYVPCAPAIKRALGLDPARPRWLFVLASEDYGRLTKGDGTPFHDLLTQQLFETLNQGRQPVLIAPLTCNLAVAYRSLTETQLMGYVLQRSQEGQEVDLAKVPWATLARDVYEAADGLVLIPYCRHDWFMSLILDAEYVFYWNMFSNSLVPRVVNRLPFFFSDPGHIARASPLLLDRVAQCYYVEGVPPCLDFSQPLDAGQLARRAAEQGPALRAMADNLLRAPRPAEVVRQFLDMPFLDRTAMASRTGPEG